MDLINTLLLHIGFIIVFGTWYYFLCHKTSKDEGKLLHAVSSSLSIFLSKPTLSALLVAAGFLSQLFVSGVLCIFHSIIPNAFASYDRLVEKANSAQTPILLILCICILAPIGEELLFRGVLFSYAKQIQKPAAAVLLQAVLFGIYHGNLVQGVYASFMGIILGALAYKFQKITPAILLHLSVNVSLYLLPAQLYKTYNLCIVTTTVSGLLLVAIFGKLFEVRPRKRQ